MNKFKFAKSFSRVKYVPKMTNLSKTTPIIVFLEDTFPLYRFFLLPLYPKTTRK